MRRLLLVLFAAALTALAATSAASAHPERTTKFPDPSKGSVPELRSSGPRLVVCKPDSAKRVRRHFRDQPREIALRLKLIRRCRYRDIQAAVNAARSGMRILIMPGIYREEPSRRVPFAPQGCEGGIRDPGDGHGASPDYPYQRSCPNARNLIGIMGDSDDDGTCDAKCNLQLQGMGNRARQVLIVGDRTKKDVIRADRADGVVIHNVTVEQGSFNGFDVVETNGFRLSRLVGRYNQNYGVLSFTSDHGLYENVEAYGNGDSGVYPGSGPEGHCQRYGIEIRRVNSYDNVLGYSGTAGNGTWTHDSKFHDNAAGISTDSFAGGHPGMPQDCSKWTDNDVSSNNLNLFENSNEAYCNSRGFEQRRRTAVCPQFQVPVGAGILLYGANANLIAHNRIYDNWRSGIRLFYVPSVIRGDYGGGEQLDTSNDNQMRDNQMGIDRQGRRDPNGVDFLWDEQGKGNCWENNAGPNGAKPTSDPLLLPACPGSPVKLPPNPVKSAQEVPCATWDPKDNPDPPGCTWFTTPPEPR